MSKALNSLASLCFFTLCLFAFTACENDAKVVAALNNKVKNVDRALNVSTQFSQEGKAKANLTAPVLLRVMADTQYIEFPKKLHVDFYDSIARVETFLDSKYGKYFESLNTVYLRDSVRIITVKGDTLRCKDLWWDQNKEIFYSDKITIYNGPKTYLVGTKGVRATQDLKTVSLLEPTGHLPVESTGLNK